MKEGIPLISEVAPVNTEKCQICGGDLTEGDSCPECEERIENLRKAIDNAKLRVSQAIVIQKKGQKSP